MTQTRDLIKKIADFFKGEEFYEKGEDARFELSPDDVRCVYDIIKQSSKDKYKVESECGMQIVINIPEKLACEGFERPFTEEEKNILIKAIGNGKPLLKTGYISINDVMSVFDDFMCSDVDEDGMDTFYEMLKEKVVNTDADCN